MMIETLLKTTAAAILLTFNTYGRPQPILTPPPINIPVTIARPIDTKKLYRSQLIEEIDKYLNKFNTRLSGEAVVDACEKYKLDPIFVLAQGQIESHFGTKGKAKRTNGVWNIDGGRYNHPDHSVEPYVKLVKKRYMGYHKSEHDLMKNYKSLRGHKYATYKHYERDLKQVYKDINRNTAIGVLYDKLMGTM